MRGARTAVAEAVVKDDVAAGVHARRHLLVWAIHAVPVQVGRRHLPACWFDTLELGHWGKTSSDAAGPQGKSGAVQTDGRTISVGPTSGVSGTSGTKTLITCGCSRRRPFVSSARPRVDEGRTRVGTLPGQVPHRKLRSVTAVVAVHVPVLLV